MFGPPEPADRLWFDVPANEWKCERTSVQLSLSVDGAGSTHGVIFMQDKFFGDAHQILVAKRRLQGEDDPAVNDECVLSNVKIMSIASWYAEQYNKSVVRVPRTTRVQFLEMWAYVLVSRTNLPVLQVETFAVDYRKVFYDSIPSEVASQMDRGEIDSSFLFSLFTFEQSGGSVLVYNPPRVCAGVWGLPQFASVEQVGGRPDGGQACMWEYMVSETHSVMKDVYWQASSEREMLLRSLRVCLVQSKTDDQLNMRLDKFMGEANRNNMTDIVEKVRPPQNLLASFRGEAYVAVSGAPLKIDFKKGFPVIQRTDGVESNPFTKATHRSLYGGVKYEHGKDGDEDEEDEHEQDESGESGESGRAPRCRGLQKATSWVAPDFSQPAPPASPTPPPTPPPPPPPPPHRAPTPPNPYAGTGVFHISCNDCLHKEG
jgi:hypothetical protein